MWYDTSLVNLVAVVLPAYVTVGIGALSSPACRWQVRHDLTGLASAAQNCRGQDDFSFIVSAVLECRRRLVGVMTFDAREHSRAVDAVVFGRVGLVIKRNLAILV